MFEHTNEVGDLARYFWRAAAALAVLAAILVPPDARGADAPPYTLVRVYTSVDEQIFEGAFRETPLPAGWAVKAILPMQTFLIHRNTIETTVMWQISGKVPNLIPNVWVDGVNVGPATRIGPGAFMANLHLRLRGTYATRHTVRLRLTQGLIVYQSAIDNVVLLPTSPFAVLEQTFRHDRCTTCHSLQTSEAIYDFHALFGIALPDDPYVRPGNYAVCHTCHLQEKTGGAFWMSPSPERAPNFKDFESAHDLCEAVVAKAAEQNTPNAPYDILTGHFMFDKRIRWAVENGWVPLDFPPEATAPPHDFYRVREYGLWWVGWLLKGKGCTGLD